MSWSVADTVSTLLPETKFSSTLVEYGPPRNDGESLLLVIVTVNVAVASPPLLSLTLTEKKVYFLTE